MINWYEMALTNDLLVGSRMINVVVSGGDWILNLLGNGHHPALSFIHLMLLVDA